MYNAHHAHRATTAPILLQPHRAQLEHMPQNWELAPLAQRECIKMQRGKLDVRFALLATNVPLLQVHQSNVRMEPIQIQKTEHNAYPVRLGPGAILQTAMQRVRHVLQDTHVLVMEHEQHAILESSHTWDRPPALLVQRDHHAPPQLLPQQCAPQVIQRRVKLPAKIAQLVLHVWTHPRRLWHVIRTSTPYWAWMFVFHVLQESLVLQCRPHPQTVTQATIH
mmetsp:Transcript_6632/g.24822  ORF Transcript_6632/g.24822 Transcript_6632/m.24822 type:complete len:222 (-) Transcript_6632:12741-13406(-)